MAVASTACAGAAAGEEEVAEAAGVVLVGAAAATVVVGEATAGEVGPALLEGAAVACPNIFDMRLVNIPIGVKYAPHRSKKPAGLVVIPPHLFDWQFAPYPPTDRDSHVG